MGSIDRRDFLGASLASTAAVLAARTAPGQAATPSSTAPPRPRSSIGSVAPASPAAGSAQDVPARKLDGAPTVLAGREVADFADGLRGGLLRATDGDYDRVRRLWNGDFDLRPALIARCTGAADVRRAVDFARAHSLLTAVRGGGHSMSGKSSCDGGMMIDLSPMHAVRVDRAARTAWVAGGALLGQLDHETAPFGLVTTAGTVSHTGVGGLTLGGGFGRVGRRFGLACDNLRAVDVVTADGRLLQASERENPDLFWGLRGGGGNFGVATGFTFALHEMNPTVLAGVIAWPLDAARDVLRALAERMASAPDALNAEPTLATMPGGPSVVLLEICWSGEAREGERVIAPLRAIGRPLFDRIAPMPYVQLQRSLDAINPHGIKAYQKAGFLDALDDEVIDTIIDIARSAPPRQIAVVFQASGGAIGRVPVTATAFPNRGSPWWLMVIANWREPSEREATVAAARAAWKRVEPKIRGFYVNAAAERDASEIRSNYGPNYARLAELKRRYDPQNLFRLNANVLPA